MNASSFITFFIYKTTYHTFLERTIRRLKNDTKNKEALTIFLKLLMLIYIKATPVY